MIKLIVSDLDGTLLPYGESKIALSTKNLIYRWLSSGNSFAVSSGRTYGELLSLLPEFEKDIYAYNLSEPLRVVTACLLNNEPTSY